MSHHQSNGYASDRPSQINIAAANTPRHANHIAPTPQAMQTPGSYAPGTTTHNTQYNPSPSPAPILQQGQHNGYNSHLQQPFPHHQPQQPLSYSGPLQGAPIGARQTQGPPPVAYKAPNPVEVWHLPDNANASIPAEIRDQFQQDAQGRVLFFTAPPAAPTETKKKLQHTPGYLAFRAKQMKEKLDSKKRNAEDTTGGAEVSREAKKSRTSSPQIIAQDVDMEVIQKQAFDNISNMLVDSTVAHLRALHGEEGLQKAVDAHLNALTSVWESNAREQQAREAGKSQRIAADKAKSNVGGLTRLLNYRPPNEHLEWRSRG
jgi:chromatin structure-remodeling complex subunit RSC1/2